MQNLSQNQLMTQLEVKTIREQVSLVSLALSTNRLKETTKSKAPEENVRTSCTKTNLSALKDISNPSENTA